jgi:hypothetical protein
MKKIATYMTVLALAASNLGHAQQSTQAKPAMKSEKMQGTQAAPRADKPAMGAAAKQGKTVSDSDFAWGIAVAGLVVLGVVVGVTAASASGSAN